VTKSPRGKDREFQKTKKKGGTETWGGRKVKDTKKWGDEKSNNSGTGEVGHKSEIVLNRHEAIGSLRTVKAWGK